MGRQGGSVNFFFSGVIVWPTPDGLSEEVDTIFEWFEHVIYGSSCFDRIG